MSAPAIGSSSYEQAPTPASIPLSSSRSDFDQDEAEGSSSARGPWWKGYRQNMKRSHAMGVGGKKRHKPFVPYDLKTVRRQSTGSIPTVGYCVDFFPFVGPRRPKATREDRNWDLWENTAAVCAGNKLNLIGAGRTMRGRYKGQLLETDMGNKPDEIEDPIEELFTITWSIDPFNLHPLVIAAGALGLIYILDVAERRLVRVLNGHGNQILALAVCPRLPHILASGSRDDTIRIWNLYGHEAAQDQEQRSENYAMADADEGNYIVAVLRGQWPGGHRDDVCALSWHPHHRALASAGRDHTFKIWAIPPLPSPVVDPPAKGYRPLSVPWPLFSTNRLTASQIDTISWLDRDLLVIHTIPEVITLQWISYSRFFQRDTWEPAGNLGRDGYDPGHYSDINDARSFTVVSTVETGGHHFYHRAGFHARFTPDSALDRTQSCTLVQDYLLAYPVPGRIPAIVVYAPIQAPPDPIPDVDLRERIDEDDFDFDRSGSEDSVQEPDIATNQTGAPIASGTTSTQEPVDTSQQVASWPTPADTLVPESDTDSDDDTSAPTPNRRRSANKSLVPKHDKAYRWTLKADIWEGIVKKHKGPYPLRHQRSDTCTIYCCAISPRGAKWILGVGLAESIFVWRLREV